MIQKTVCDAHVEAETPVRTKDRCPRCSLGVKVGRTVM